MNHILLFLNIQIPDFFWLYIQSSRYLFHTLRILVLHLLGNHYKWRIHNRSLHRRVPRPLAVYHSQMPFQIFFQMERYLALLHR
nr:MAG TPA: hypothetical protein [Caudoviricetes sp.]